MQGDEDKIVPPNQVRSLLTSRHRIEIRAASLGGTLSCCMLMSGLSALLSAALSVI